MLFYCIFVQYLVHKKLKSLKSQNYPQMKRNRVKKTLTFSVIIAISLLGLTAFTENDQMADSTKTTSDVPNTRLDVSISGTISHTKHTPNQTGTVTFNRFPCSIDEFKSVQSQIGGEPHGAVVMELMAAEMYRRNAAIGTECLKLCNTPLNINAQIRRWKELFGKDENYNRPYQIGAFLKGATHENRYTPNEPYTIEVKVNNGRPYGNTLDYQSTMLYLDVLTKGKDSGSETVAVVKPNPCRAYPNGSDYFLVDNCPGLYSQVKEIYEPNWDKLK